MKGHRAPAAVYSGAARFVTATHCTFVALFSEFTPNERRMSFPPRNVMAFYLSVAIVFAACHKPPHDSRIITQADAKHCLELRALKEKYCRLINEVPDGTFYGTCVLEGATVEKNCLDKIAHEK
jgi:hypothetical protein